MNNVKMNVAPSKDEAAMDYIAVIGSSAVRDTQVCASACDDPRSKDWKDLKGAEPYLGVFHGTKRQAATNAASYGCTVPENIRLVDLPERTTKLITLHIGSYYARTFRVPAGWTSADVTERVEQVCMEVKADDCQSLLTDLPEKAFAAKGLVPYGLEDVSVSQRDFRNEAMEAAGIGMANCWVCARFIDPSFCELYESDVDDTDPSNHGNQNCCRNNMVYQVLYGDDPKAVEYFLLRDKRLLDDELGLLTILVSFFPAVKAMVERPDFVLSKTRIQAAQT